MTDVDDAQLEALVAAAEEGVALDGLIVTDEGGENGEGGEDREDGQDGKDGEDREDGVGDRYTFATGSDTHAGLDEAGLGRVAAQNPWYVSNWYYWEAIERPPAERAFLRWLEDADERDVPDRYEAMAEGRLAASWGQLHVTIRLGEHGHRVYTVRHAEDADREPEALEVHTDPRDAREIVTFDDRGRYRPLKTAPTLPTGWAFVDLDGRALAETVGFVYPATVANWYRERRGELDVSHWRETMARQTGIYGVVETWDRGEGHEHVNWVAEACCVDSQCLKRREWAYDEETPLEVDGGDGAFPCREPCSLVVSAARTWTTLEGEEPRTYEFELTPSEKEQLEAIVDAVADGRTDDIREADFSDGANRYRARFLRAKRFDDEGDLCGVATDEWDGAEGADGADGADEADGADG